MAVAIYVNARADLAQLSFQARAAQYGIQQPVSARYIAGHEIDARQEVGERDDLACAGRGNVAIQASEMRGHVERLETWRPATRVIIHPHAQQVGARLAEGVVVPAEQRR